MINLHLQRAHGSIKHRQRVRWQIARLLLPAISACVGYGCQKGPNPFTFSSYQLAAACPKYKSKSHTPAPLIYGSAAQLRIYIYKSFSSTFSQISVKFPEVTPMLVVHLASRGTCGVLDWYADASPYLARTASWLWLFLASHTDSLGRKLILVLSLRLNAPQAHVRRHVAFASASVPSCSIWKVQ